jgi:hypothetical protein
VTEYRSGRYKVVSKRDYRGHPTDTEFVARLEANAERRAMDRGAIMLLARVTPALEPGSFTFPTDWLSPVTDHPNPRKEG